MSLVSSIIALGALKNATGEYIHPKMANKKEKYICPDCEKDLVLCQGNIRIYHFRHKIDIINQCHRYTSPSESQIHKDAKQLLKYLLEKKIPISFIRNCVYCKSHEECKIQEITTSSSIVLEHRFDYNGDVADVAYIEDNKIIYIFEIYNTHKTCNENRPEPWFEIDARNFLNQVNNIGFTSLQIACIRNDRKCDDCIEKHHIKKNFKKYIRIKLGQKFPVPDDEYAIKGYHDQDHLRLDFHAYDDEAIDSNKYILSLFEEHFCGKHVYFHSYKGNGILCISPNIKCYPHDFQLFQNHLCYQEKKEKKMFSEDKYIEFSGNGTVETIFEIIQLFKII